MEAFSTGKPRHANGSRSFEQGSVMTTITPHDYPLIRTRLCEAHYMSRSVAWCIYNPEAPITKKIVGSREWSQLRPRIVIPVKFAVIFMAQDRGHDCGGRLDRPPGT